MRMFPTQNLVEVEGMDLGRRMQGEDMDETVDETQMTRPTSRRVRTIYRIAQVCGALALAAPCDCMPRCPQRRKGIGNVCHTATAHPSHPRSLTRLVPLTWHTPVLSALLPQLHACCVAPPCTAFIPVPMHAHAQFRCDRT